MDELRIFLAVAALQSFATAARQLDLSPASVTRAVATLEARLNVRLFTRTTRQVRLTAEGDMLFARCGPLVQELQDVEDELRSGRLGPNGTFRVSAPISFGRRHIAPLVARYRQRYPAIAAQLVLTDESDDLASREFDCAIRVGAPTKGDYVTRRLLKARRVVCAAPTYLAVHGTPEHPNDLGQHQTIALLRDGRTLDRWMFEIDDVMQTVQVPVGMSSNSGEVTQEWALAGLGIVLKSLWDVEEDLAQGRLMELLAPFCADTADIYIVYPARRYLPSRVRSFIDLVSVELAGYGDRLRRPSGP